MKFSIITITYNRAHLIGETIQSVLDQTHADFEHIIIDDGSTDDTKSVVNSYNDARIKYYKYEKNSLRSFLRNEGFRKADGDFICVLDSDDIWKNNKLAMVNTLFTNNPDINFVIHNLSFIPKNETLEEVFSAYKLDFHKTILSEILNDKILPFSTFSIKKEALNQIGLLDENMIDGQYDLYARAAARFKVYYCAKKLAFIRKHNQNTSKNKDMRHYDDCLKTIDKLKNDSLISPIKHAFLKSKIYSKIAYIYHKQKQSQEAKQNYFISFQTRKFSYQGLKSLVMYLKINLIP